ncbi:hypothetical protein [Bradyrhizobium manausense]|nr:hypothetical protein [Bradyrhizobium manausense]
MGQNELQTGLSPWGKATPVRHEPSARTRFRVTVENEETLAEIVFGPDIYPGTSVVDPNSSLSMQAAAAHELCHYYRWRDKTEVEDGVLVHVDEALTSLEAVLRFPKLGEHDIRQLVSDAIQRLQIFVQEKNSELRT